MSGATNDTKTRMVAGAKTLMRRRGFSSTSFKDVWEFTATPRGSVYFHFPDGKQQLGLEVISSALDTLLEWTEAAQANSTGVSDFVVSLAKEMADFLEDSGFDEGCPIAAIAIEASATSDVLRQAASAAFQTWGERIAAILVARSVDWRSAPASATAMTAALQGAIVISKSDRSRQALEVVADVIVRGLPV